MSRGFRAKETKGIFGDGSFNTDRSMGYVKPTRAQQDMMDRISEMISGGQFGDIQVNSRRIAEVAKMAVAVREDAENQGLDEDAANESAMQYIEDNIGSKSRGFKASEETSKVASWARDFVDKNKGSRNEVSKKSAEWLSKISDAVAKGDKKGANDLYENARKDLTLRLDGKPKNEKTVMQALSFASSLIQSSKSPTRGESKFDDRWLPGKDGNGRTADDIEVD